MYERASIPCVIINGWAHGGIEEILGHINNVRHSWNAIKLQNEWRPIDCAWASLDFIRGDSTDFYFFTPPDEFICSHYPENDRWKLCNPYFNLNEFKQMPYVKPFLFSFLKQKIPLKGHIKTNAKYFDLDDFLNIDSTFEFEFADKKSDAVMTVAVHTIRVNGVKKYHIPIPYPGEWEFRIGKNIPIDARSSYFKELICFFVIRQ